MRASAARAAAIASALALIAGAERTWAQSDCQAAFERWSQLSSAQVRPVHEVGGRGACIPSENVRRSLLDALRRAGGLCGDSSDARLQPTRTLISINHSFIASLSVCRTENADADAGWSSKTLLEKEPPKAEKQPPKLAAPITPPPIARPPIARPPIAQPKPPPPVTGGPRPSVIKPAPKPVAVAPPPKETATATPKPPCLEVAAKQGDVYSFINRRCKGHSVLAVIETRAASGETACRGYTVGTGVNLRGAATPRINYECVATAGGCNKERLGGMFPECDW